MHEELILAERLDDCLVLRLNRPGHGNAVSLALAESLTATLLAHASDPALRAIVLTGAGDKFFCTGGDVKAYAGLANEQELDTVFGAARKLLNTIETLPLPVIAAINGYAIGGGAELALACDLRVMDAAAQIGFPQVRLGIIPGWDGIERLSALIGKGAATRLLLLGERVDAASAQAIGLVHELAPAGMAVSRARELASVLRQTAPLAVGAVKAALRDAAGSTPQAARLQARAAFAHLWFTADHKEAEQAFVQKRAPCFAGK